MSFGPVTRPASLVLLAVTAASCASTMPTAEEIQYEQDVKAKEIIPASADTRAQIKLQDPVTQATFWSLEYEKNPANIESATAFVSALRAIGSEKKAAEIASQTLALDPDNTELLSLFGKSLLASGNPKQAVDSLRRAQAANPSDLSLTTALGVSYDQTGRHREAQSTYRRVLAENPFHTSSLSNLGLSLALTGEPEEAEKVLRLAVAQPDSGERERQNLSMVLSILGQFEEARELGSADLPDDQVDQNIAYFRSMLTPKSRSYGVLRGTLE